MKTRLTHVRANVSDLHRAIAWYEDVVGFECLGADITDQWQYAQFAGQGGATFSVMVGYPGDKAPGLIFISIRLRVPCEIMRIITQYWR